MGSEKWEVRSGKWEVRSEKWEVGSERREVGSEKWEVRGKLCSPAIVQKRECDKWIKK